MSTHGLILEGLRMKREASAREYMNKNPRIGLQAIIERNQNLFLKNQDSKNNKIVYSQIRLKQLNEDKMSTLDEMPSGKLKEPVVIIYGDGDKYVGEVRDRLPDGNGTVVSTNGEVYCGGWKNGNPHGCGVYIYAEGHLFIGVWGNGNRHGKGDFYIDGEEYECEYDNGKFIRLNSSIVENAHK